MFFVWSLIASYWSFIGHGTSNHVTIASSRWHALWVILVFSALKNLLSPTWLAFTQFKPCWHICPCKKMFVGHWPLFLHNNSQPLTCLILTDWLQQIFSTAGFPRVVAIIIIIIIIIITFKKLFFLELKISQWVCGPITFLLLINFAVFDGSYHLRMLRYCFKRVDTEQIAQVSQLFQLFHFLMRKHKDYGYTVHRDPSFV